MRFFGAICYPLLGINPGKPFAQARSDPMNVADRPSDFELLQGEEGVQGRQ
jgi:hypothetical protein